MPDDCAWAASSRSNGSRCMCESSPQNVTIVEARKSAKQEGWRAASAPLEQEQLPR